MEPAPRVTGLLDDQGLIERNSDHGEAPRDLTREPLAFPAGRDLRLQNLARGDEGFLLGLAYSTQRGYGG
jgi:alpha-D-ribose 1-methylphosphonate 5-triphosphate synthase subunit PhnI